MDEIKKTYEDWITERVLLETFDDIDSAELSQKKRDYKQKVDRRLLNMFGQDFYTNFQLQRHVKILTKTEFKEKLNSIPETFRPTISEKEIAEEDLSDLLYLLYSRLYGIKCSIEDIVHVKYRLWKRSELQNCHTSFSVKRAQKKLKCRKYRNEVVFLEQYKREYVLRICRPKIGDRKQNIKMKVHPLKNFLEMKYVREEGDWLSAFNKSIMTRKNKESFEDYLIRLIRFCHTVESEWLNYDSVIVNNYLTDGQIKLLDIISDDSAEGMHTARIGWRFELNFNQLVQLYEIFECLYNEGIFSKKEYEYYVNQYIYAWPNQLRNDMDIVIGNIEARIQNAFDLNKHEEENGKDDSKLKEMVLGINEDLRQIQRIYKIVRELMIKYTAVKPAAGGRMSTKPENCYDDFWDEATNCDLLRMYPVLARESWDKKALRELKKHNRK